MNGSIVVAALHGQEAFRGKDLEVVRKEVAMARRAGPAPDPAACAKEAGNRGAVALLVQIPSYHS